MKNPKNTFCWEFNTWVPAVFYYDDFTMSFIYSNYGDAHTISTAIFQANLDKQVAQWY